MNDLQPIAAVAAPPTPSRRTASSRPRILFLIDEMTAITAGGTERQLLQQVGIAQRNGLDPQICVLRGTEWLTPAVAGCDVTHFNIHAIRSRQGLRSLLTLTRWIRGQKFQILQPFFAESNLLAPWIGKAAGVPIILGTRRNLSHSTKEGLHGIAASVQSLSNLLVDEIIANSDAVLQHTRSKERFANGKLRVVYNGIELSQLRPPSGARENTRRELGIHDDDLLVGNISGLRAVKGVDLFVEAAALAAKSDPRLKFVLVGDGDMRPAVEAAIRKHGLEQRFHLVGAAEDVRSFLAAMDIAVLCSFAEGFSNSLLEYMAAGLPIIATDVGGNHEALGEAGILIQPNDSGALSKAILALADPALRDHFGNSARREIQRFDIQHAELRMGEIYWQLLNPQKKISSNGDARETSGTKLILAKSSPSMQHLSSPFRSLVDLVLTRIQPLGDATAVLCDGESLTYRQLDQRSAQLAVHLARLGIGPGHRVGILMDRSTQMLVALLGVLRSGAAYVPLYQLDPLDRLQSVLEDAGVSLVLTLDHNLSHVPAQFASLSLQSPEWQQQSNLSSLPPAPAPDSTAYLIFTSGSTGKPKGVAVSHNSVVNLLLSVQQLLNVTPQDRLLAVTTINFDIAALELFLPLITGSGLVIASREDAMDGARLTALIREHNISILQATPHTWRFMLDAGFQSFPGLTMLCGGEPWARELADRLLAGGGRLWNMYGPTETTIWSTACEITKSSGPITLGHPLANTHLYLLDENLQPVPGAASAELFVGGDGVAQGYHNRPDLTEQRFLPDPFRPGANMYRTGDIVRRRDDNSIQFVGRADNQIKLRGYRIELEEVERAIVDTGQVQQCVTRVAQDPRGESRLVAYFTTGDLSAFDANKLRAALYDRLPGAMVPTVFVHLAEFPLTQNLKIDRKRLPDPDWSSFTQLRDTVHHLPSQSVPATPSPVPDPRVANMLSLWQEVFPDLLVDSESNFFDLGGQSLDFARLQTKIEQEFGVHPSVEDILAAPSVSGLAHRIAQSQPRPASNSRLIAIQSGGSQPPLFLISQSLIFRQVARHLGSDQPVYTIQMRDEDIAHCGPHPTFESIAAFYSGIIRQARPQGPYRLGGWCASGWLAFEVAQQLQASGEEVELLVIVDAWAPNYWRDLGPFHRFLAGMNYDFSRLRIHMRGLRSHSVDTKARFLLDRLRVRVMGTPDREVDAEATEVDRLVEHAVTTYRPQPFHGNTLLFCSVEQPTGAFIAPDMGWARFLDGPPPGITRLPGDHRQIFDDPGAAILARQVAARLYGQRNEVPG
jgi:amino acid adenylation domain-containing protein